jgi:3-oxoadipate enol-lactonase/4-carboxymuconolactone decarboxylase
MDQFANASGVKLRYRVDGPADGPALLLSNSLGTTLELWDAQVAEWARHARVIRYDTRGHGGSASTVGRALSGPPEYTLDQLGHDALAVLDAAGARAAHICGISLGGLTAMWLGVNAPHRVSSLIVANTAAKVGTAERWTDRMAKVRNEGMTAIADMVMGAWFTEGFRKRHPDVIARFHAMVAACPPEGYSACCAALRDADLREAITGIRARTLVIGGDEDPSTPLAGSEEIQRSIPGAVLVTFPCAHLSNVELAEEFTSQGGAFYRSSGDAMRRRILGNAHVDRSLANATPLDADFLQLLTRYVWGEIWTRPGLDERTRRVLVIGTMIALGRWEEFALHARAALTEGGFTQDDLEEIILQQAVYCGVPAANHAFRLAAEIVKSGT